MHLAVMSLSSPLLWESVSLPLSCMLLAFSRNAAIYSVDCASFWFYLLFAGDWS